MEHLFILQLVEFEVLFITLGLVVVMLEMILESHHLASLLTRVIQPGTQLRFMHRGDAFRKGVCIFLMCSLYSLVFKYNRLLSFFARYTPTVIEANVYAAHGLSPVCKYYRLFHFLFRDSPLLVIFDINYTFLLLNNGWTGEVACLHSINIVFLLELTLSLRALIVVVAQGGGRLSLCSLVENSFNINSLSHNSLS